MIPPRIVLLLHDMMRATLRMARRAMKPYRSVQIVAWGILILLVAIPLFILTTVRAANSWWVVWAVVSIWATLDSRNLANAASPERARRHTQSTVIIVLGVLNLLLSLYVVLLPGATVAGK